MTEMLPYALISILAAALFLSLVLTIRSTRKSVNGIEQRISSLEKDLDRIQKGVGEQSARNSEEINLKNRQLREEIRTALQASAESVMRKIAENDSIHKSRLDSLAAQISALQQNYPREAAKPAEKAAASQAKPQAAPANDANAKARRLARLIVSEIALYNRKNVEEGVRSGNFYDLLAHDIKEAHAMYARRVPEEIRSTTKYLDEAFAELIEKTRRELNL